ncbi:glutathione peroxidase [Nitrogeniibacter aestuarii]|uniref:glutathione peroxidase n=1 Tax=Nitrogeniibacter aestuarii TaxID=2815343 RepID=UPI0022AAB8B8|nr:glutathione peroxidase [Nitrogeniibacter aestuarii]
MRRLIATALLLLFGTVPAQAQPPCPPLLQQPYRALQGGEQGDMCRFAGKVILVVNTASRCAFTPQYEGLETLYRTYQSRGLVIVGFPSNDFGNQEPGDAAQIKDFCETTYGVKFPLHAKTAVTGADAHPLYKALFKQTGQVPGWNFHKYLIDHTGTEVVSLPSQVQPTSARMVELIEARLNTRNGND